MILFHGSPVIVKEPSLEKGKPYNDYGQGFYCTQDIDLAKEWACKEGTDGYVNQYELDDSDLKILNLNDKHPLCWVAILLKHRTFNVSNEIAKQAREYIINKFYIDVKEYDLVIGYRADDSYFSYANSFISNNLSLQSLVYAMKLGDLGYQVALVSKKAFENLKYMNAEKADASIYFVKYDNRDKQARKEYKESLNNHLFDLLDLFVLDIIRERMELDDERLQGIIF